MSESSKASGTDLFIVDNSNSDWKVRDYLSEWADIAKKFDIATGYFEGIVSVFKIPVRDKGLKGGPFKESVIGVRPEPGQISEIVLFVLRIGFGSDIEDIDVVVHAHEIQTDLEPSFGN